MDYFLGSTGEAAIGNRKLKVKVGPSIHCLTPCHVNNENHPHFIDSPYFTGRVLIRIKNFKGINPQGSSQSDTSEKYFENHKRLFSIQVQGRFKHEYTADEVLFGAEFEKKISPPTGAWVAIKFANLIDPALLTDLYAEKPWLYSPILCAMNIVNVQLATTPIASVHPPKQNEKDQTAGPDLSNPKRQEIDRKEESSKATFENNVETKLLGEWVPGEMKEDTTFLFSSSAPFSSDSIQGRRKHFQNETARKSTVFTPDNVYNFEIFAPFMDLNTFDLSLGINVNCLKYCENQPIRLMSKSRSENIPFFVIEYDLVQ